MAQLDRSDPGGADPGGSRPGRTGSVIVPFLYVLRERGVPVGTQELLSLARVLGLGLHESSLDGFYNVARAILVHSERHLDAFDQSFASYFRGIETEAISIEEELLKWLEGALERPDALSEGDRRWVESLDPKELERLFDERRKEQREQHDRGDHWVGRAGRSPFGHGGAPRSGVRVGGKGGGRSALRVADARLYEGYREDLTLDVRQMQLALRKLRVFDRDGSDLELDLDGTLEATAKCAGELDIVCRPRRRPNTRLLLLMDVGGSMDPYAHLCSRLFSAAGKSSHFRELRTYYFHNCIYGQIYKTERFEEPVKIRDLIHECPPHYKLIVVGDALMAPYELMMAGGGLSLGDDAAIEGIAWLVMLRNHFHQSVWLNPEPRRFWRGNTIERIASVFDMHPLTLEGLGEAIAALARTRA